METRRQGTTLMTGICLLIGVMVIIQLWLVAAAVDAMLSEEVGVLVPTTLVSAALFLINAGLLGYVFSFDERVRRRGG